MPLSQYKNNFLYRMINNGLKNPLKTEVLTSENMYLDNENYNYHPLNASPTKIFWWTLKTLGQLSETW